MIAFIHGIILAFGLILPLGAQNMFVFNQGAVQRSIWGWLPVVAAAALCDTLLILLAVCGVSVAVLSLAWLKNLLVVAGVVFLGYIGWLTWKAPVQNISNDDSQTAWPFRRKIMFTLSVSLLNPHAILDTIGVIGTSSLSYTGDAKIGFTLACIMVSWLWFFLLANLGRLLRTFDSSGRIMMLINRFSAVIMWFSAIYLVNSLR